jgi:hypothetical protein
MSVFIAVESHTAKVERFSTANQIGWSALVWLRAAEAMLSVSDQSFRSRSQSVWASDESVSSLDQLLWAWLVSESCQANVVSGRDQRLSPYKHRLFSVAEKVFRLEQRSSRVGEMIWSLEEMISSPDQKN